MILLYRFLNNAGKFILVYNLILFQMVKLDDYEYRLVSDLLEDYNALARPSLSHLDPTNVTFDLSLSQLIDVDEKNQLITTNAWVTMKWIDYKLRWNSSQYGGIQEIRLPYDKIWKPDVILYNNADALASMAQISTQMIIFSDGSVTWLSTSIYRSSCSINVQYFPFDNQNCSLSFASWTYDGNSLNLLKTADLGDTSNYLANGEWHLNHLLVERHVKIYSCCPNPYPNVTYYIVITRRPLFYVFNMIFPSLLITLVGFLGFLIPPDSGEKISMGVTTLLSMTVFLMVIADSMPPNSDSVPLIATYYFGSMLIISLATAGTVLTLNVFKRGEGDEPVPPIIQKIFFDFIARILFINLNLNRELDSSVKNIYTNLKSYYINSSVEKFINLESTKILKFNKSFRMMSLKRQLDRSAHRRIREELRSQPVTSLKSNKDSHRSKFLEILIKNKDRFRTENASDIETINHQESPIIQPKNINRHVPKYSLAKQKNSLPADVSETYVQNQQQRPERSVLYRTTSMIASDYLESTNIGKNNQNLTPQKRSEKREDRMTITTYPTSGSPDASRSCLGCTDLNSEKRRLTKMLRAVNENLEKNELKEVINLYRQELKAQWTQLAQVIDALLLYMFTFSTFLLLFFLINQAPNAKIF